ncbi:MAG TPA: exodeoxyribonuclease III [Candidatus Nitrosotenuis sp.]|jgi:exodeoxyribonuclease-3|nr:exodeoxyribonuclease III [Candidatus Nitrosotenuis sp.]
MLKVATWNVNGLRARQAQLQQWLAEERPDVVCLQEIKCSTEQVPPELRDLADYWCYWHGAPGGYSGVGLLVSRRICPDRPVFEHPDFDFQNRIVVARTGLLTVASVYVPNGNRDFPGKIRFLEALIEMAGQSAREDLVVAGDLNVARSDIDVHPKERKPRAIGQLPEERERIEKLLAQGLVDLGRHFDPDNDRLFTWWPPWRNLRQRNIGWRLDYVLASPSMARRCLGCRVRPEVGTSDHAPVVAEFTQEPLEKPLT